MVDAPITETREFDLSQSPAALWPLLADTNRLNEAIGLPRYALSVDRESDEPMLVGHALESSRRQSWEERPFEWVAGQWWRFERRYLSGPLLSLSATLMLKKTPVGGTLAQYAVSAEPDGMIGRTLLASGFLRKIASTLQDKAEEADAFLAGARPTPFSTRAATRPREAERAIDGRAAEMAKSPYANGASPALASMLAEAPESDLAEIRVRRLARILELPERQTAEACLAASRAGLLKRRFVVVCPRCRRPCADAASLAELPDRARCQVDAIEFGCDLALNVESVFTAAPEARRVDRGVFCGSGPMTAPHVVIQQLLAPGERRVFPFASGPGGFRLRADPVLSDPQAPDDAAETAFEHGGGAFPMLAASVGAVAVGAPSPDGSVVFENHSATPRLMRLERRQWRADALSAAELIALQAYRDLFPDDAPPAPLRCGSLVFAHVALSAEARAALYRGDERPARALAVLAEGAAQIARVRSGGVARSLADGISLVFLDPYDAVAAALELRAEAGERLGGAGDAALAISYGVAAGRTVAGARDPGATPTGLDLIGRGAGLAADLAGAAASAGVAISAELLGAEGVAEILSGFEHREGAVTPPGATEPHHFAHVSP